MRRLLAIAVAGLTLGACTPHQAVAIHFGTDPVLHGQAQRIVDCESRWNPHAVSPTNDHGLFQINATTWNKPGHHDPIADWIGRHWHKRFDPLTNAHMAKLIHNRYGWSAWSCRP